MPRWFGEALDGARMAFRFLHFVEPVVGHAIFCDRLDQAEVSLTAAPRAAEGFRAIVDVVQPCELQRKSALTRRAASRENARTSPNSNAN